MGTISGDLEAGLTSERPRLGRDLGLERDVMEVAQEGDGEVAVGGRVVHFDWSESRKAVKRAGGRLVVFVLGRLGGRRG